MNNRISTKKLVETLMYEFNSMSLLKEKYPMLVREGVDEGALHSYIVSYLAILGDRIGYSAVVDAPIFDKSLGIITERDYGKRPDSLWLDKDGIKRVIFEFERYVTENKLEEKAKNLVVMNYDSHNELQLIGFIYWTFFDKEQPKIDNIKTILVNGFRSSGAIYPSPSCPILIIKCLVQSKNNKVVLKEFMFMDKIVGQWIGPLHMLNAILSKRTINKKFIGK